MTDSPVKQGSLRRFSDYKWLGGTLVFVLLRALPNLRYPIARDQATYCLIGQGILHGMLPYRDLWDNKPPGIFYIYALIVKIFGPVMWSVGVVDILWLLAISCCIFYFTRRYLGAPAAALAVVFNAWRHCRQGYIHAGQPETFLMLAIFGAWFLIARNGAASDGSDGPPEQDGAVQRGRLVAAGLVLGMAFWLKYNAVVFFPFLMLVPFLDFKAWDCGSTHVRMVIPWKDWLGRTSLVAAGFVVAIAGVLAYIWAAGAWPAMREAQFEVLPRYGATAFKWNLEYLAWALRDTQFHLGIWTEAMPALSLLIAWKRREVRLLAPILALALAGYLSAAMQGRFHPYYFETCYPFVSIFWGYVCVKVWEGFQFLRRVCAQRGWMLARALLWVVLAALVFSLLPEESVRIAQQYGFLAEWWRNPEASYNVYWYQSPLEELSEQMQVINYLKRNSSPQDEVYLWGYHTLINLLSQRKNPSRFVSNLALMSTWGPESWRQELVRTLETTQPRFIVVARHDEIFSVTRTYMDSEQGLHAYAPLANLLEQQYVPAANYDHFEIYQRKAAQSKPHPGEGLENGEQRVR